MGDDDWFAQRAREAKSRAEQADETARRVREQQAHRRKLVDGFMDATYRALAERAEHYNSMVGPSVSHHLKASHPTPESIRIVGERSQLLVTFGPEQILISAQGRAGSQASRPDADLHVNSNQELEVRIKEGSGFVTIQPREYAERLLHLILD